VAPKALEEIFGSLFVERARSGDLKGGSADEARFRGGCANVRFGEADPKNSVVFERL
jgi:hypothetical protein